MAPVEKYVRKPVNILSLSLVEILMFAYLIFVIFFTPAKFLENKIYIEKRQFFNFLLLNDAHRALGIAQCHPKCAQGLSPVLSK